LWIDAAAVEFVVDEWAKEELAVTEVEWPQPPRAPPPPPLPPPAAIEVEFVVVVEYR
jgi:hypothetical protein